MPKIVRQLCHLLAHSTEQKRDTMKYMSKSAALWGVTLPLLLTACGGSDKSVEAPEVPVNNAPQAVAGVNKTVLENDSVILDGRGSSDEDGDVLSYHWVRTSGPEVTLSNPNSAQLSFVAPEVDASTELVFELQVTDANQQASRDLVSIWVQNQKPEQLAKQLMVRPISHALTAEAGKTVDIAYQYDMNGESQLPVGIMLKLHWDSSRLSFKEFNEVLAVNHLGVSEVMQDTGDDDHNPDTDQYVILSWLNYESAQWLEDVTLPAPLFAASFDPVVGAVGSTQVTVSSHFNSPGYKLRTQVVSVEL